MEEICVVLEGLVIKNEEKGEELWSGEVRRAVDRKRECSLRYK